jgi:hypothetical protein
MVGVHFVPPSLVLADALDDEGLDRMAAAVRWMAHGHRDTLHPSLRRVRRRHGGGMGWYWWRYRGAGRARAGPHQLPADVFDRLGSPVWPQWATFTFYGTHWAALVRAADAWHRAELAAAKKAARKNVQPT